MNIKYLKNILKIFCKKLGNTPIMLYLCKMKFKLFKMEKTFIYALVEPLNENEIRYIGKANDPFKRLREHIAEAGKRKVVSHKSNWIYGLLQKGLQPKMIVLDEISKDSWDVMERYWISQLKSWGFSLTNGDEGGLAGGNDNSVESKEKARQSMYQRWYDGEIDTYEYKLWKEINGLKKPRKVYQTKERNPLYWKTQEHVDKYKLHAINATTGEVVKTYDCPKDCIEDLKLKANTLREMLNNKTHKYKGKNGTYYNARTLSYKGYVFIYVKNYDPQKSYIVDKSKKK